MWSERHGRMLSTVRILVTLHSVRYISQSLYTRILNKLINNLDGLKPDPTLTIDIVLVEYEGSILISAPCNEPRQPFDTFLQLVKL